jgi:RNA polymerase primary sigma factor
MKDMTILKQYIGSISKYPRISLDEEKELADKIKMGDHTALEKLINANLKLVVKIAVDICKGSTSVMDVIQNGNIGLMKAAEKFDSSRGVKFSTYAAFWIRQSILRGFVKPSLNVTISYRKDEINKKIKKFVKDYFSEKGKFPAITDVVNQLNVKRRDVIDVLLLFKSNGDLLSRNGGTDLGDDYLENIQDNSYNPEKIVENRLLTDDVLKAIESFPERESEIIKNRYGFCTDEKETLNTLGTRYSISAEATRQIERRVLSVLRTRFPSLAHYYYAA